MSISWQQKMRDVNRLLKWYRSGHRFYPWRTTTDPYRIWMSEILLQQTRIAVVLQRYEMLLMQFPTIQLLAAARDSDFLSAWSGLGYYRRARNMLECARQILRNHDGRFPSDLQELLSLPGIGRYTAGAIRNVCFHRMTPSIDGNIGRVMARLIGCSQAIGSRSFRERTEQFFMDFGRGANAGEYFQALMELGETVCLPRPNCEACPLRRGCVAYRKGNASSIPHRKPKRSPENYEWYLLVLSNAESLYFAQNKARPFLQDAWIFPDLMSPTALADSDLRREFKKVWGIELPKFRRQSTVRHAITFRRVTAHILVSDDYTIHRKTGKWLHHRRLSRAHTSSITFKVLQQLKSVVKRATAV